MVYNCLMNCSYDTLFIAKSLLDSLVFLFLQHKYWERGRLARKNCLGLDARIQF